MFEQYNSEACCLCGSTEDLTGEHKIKASALRAEFGTDPMVIGRFGGPNHRVKAAQSVKSKAFHFSSRMCGNCNSARTQSADREFDRFHRMAREILAEGKDPKLVFTTQRYAVGTDAYLNVFRYFSKLLCCHMAEVGAPRAAHLSKFALSLSKANRVWLDINEDWKYKQITAECGDLQYAAHGGLAVYGKKTTGAAMGFHSTLTLGPLRYVFFSRLNPIEALDIQLRHRQFHKWCSARVMASKVNPMSEEDRLLLGFALDVPPDTRR